MLESIPESSKSVIDKLGLGQPNQGDGLWRFPESDPCMPWQGNKAKSNGYCRLHETALTQIWKAHQVKIYGNESSAHQHCNTEKNHTNFCTKWLFHRKTVPQAWFSHYGNQKTVTQVWFSRYGSRKTATEVWKWNFGDRKTVTEVWDGNYRSRTIGYRSCILTLR